MDFGNDNIIAILTTDEDCGNEDISDNLTTDEKANLSKENKIEKEIQDDPQNSSDILEKSSYPSKISTDQTSNPKANDVDDMTYKEVLTLLDQLGIDDISEDAGINKNVLKEILYGGSGWGRSDEKAKHMIDITMKKHKAIKKQLLDSYSDFIAITNMSTFKKELQKPLKKRFPGFIKHMKDTLETLKKDSPEFQIVILGETSAGKSTFLNILLGAKILPGTLLHTTSCICRLHNSLDKKISYDNNDGNKTLKLTSDDPNEIEEELSKIVGPKTSEDTNTKSLRLVDIYWPIPLLKEDVILVDTPGIGETKLLTKQIDEYVPKADGYIFIIDSSHAGGVQQDRVLYLLQEIKRQQGSEMRDFSNVLFVCNKWDLVQKIKPEEVDRVLEDTWKKLRLVCGMLEKWQIITFSSKLELELLKLKANHTDAYVEVLTGIENVLMGAMYKRTGCHLEWIHKFMMEMNNLIEMQIRGAGSDLNKARNAMQILKENSAILAKESRVALEFVRTKTTYIAEEFRKHLENPQTLTRLEVTLNTTLTPLLIRMSLREHVLLQLQIIILEWIQNGPMSIESKTMDKKIDSLENQMKTTLKTIEWFGFPTTFARNEGGLLSKIKSWDGPGPTQAALGLLVCIFIGAILIPFTLGISLLIPAVLSSAYLFFQLRSLLISRIARNAVVQAKSHSCIKTLVSHCFEKPYTEKILELQTEFERTISFIHKTIAKIEEDAKNKRNIPIVFQEFRNKIEDRLRRLQNINMLYAEQTIVAFQELKIDQILSKTDAFHLYTVKGDFEGKDVTLRELNPHFSVFYMKEIENIRAMDHNNFATHVAMVSTFPESMETCPWLMVLIEPSSGDLETYVLNHGNKIGSVVGESAKETFIHISYGISNGLAYIHSKGFLHGQLQLSTVLLCTHMVPKLCDLNVLPYYKERNYEKCTCLTAPELCTHMVPKLCDLNVLPYYKERNYEKCTCLTAPELCTHIVPKLCDLNVLPYYKERNYEKCIYHTAPEVIKDGTYGPEADVYSYGILLWELWYGRHTKRNESLNELIVCSGGRPELEEKRLPQDLEKVITMCWAGDQDQRPTADMLKYLLKPNEPV